MEVLMQQLSEEQPGLHLQLIVSIQLHMTLEFQKQLHICNDRDRVSVTLQAAPSLEGSVRLGIHTINIDFPAEESSDIINPPIRDPPLSPGEFEDLR